MLLTFKVHHWKYEVYDAEASILCTHVSGILLIRRIVLWVSGTFSWLNISSLADTTFWTIRVLRFLPLPHLQSKVPVDQVSSAIAASFFGKF